MAWWLGHWIANPVGPSWKPPGSSKADSVFDPSQVDQIVAAL